MGEQSGYALVTGGSRGIGRAIAQRLAADGYAIALGYAARREAADETVAAIRSAGGRAEAFAADLGDASAIARLFEAADRAFGRLGLLVANAAILGDRAPIDAQTADGLARLLAVNVTGPILCAGEAIRRMSTRHGGQGGAIVLLSSVAGRLGGLPGLVPYAATKGAIDTLARGLANEVGGEGIRVNAVAPGVTETEMIDDGARDVARSTVPLRRVGRPEEVAEAVAWLASSAASFVTGTTLTVSGGR